MEGFKKIPMLFNLYEISADGKHFRRVSTGKELKISEGVQQGYSSIVLTINKRYKEEDVLRSLPKAHLHGVHKDGSPVHQITLKVHQLVYNAWVGEVPDGMVIDHIDRNKTNNSVENLRVVTPKENQDNAKPTKKYDWGFAEVVTPKGGTCRCANKEAAIRFIAEILGKAYRTVYNAIYSFGQFKGYRIVMESDMEEKKDV